MQPVSVRSDLQHAEVTQGKFAVSIGTSLSLETLFGINDLIPAPTPLPYTKYGYLLINVRTLVRNMYGAVQKELKSDWPVNKYLEKVMAEIEAIPDIVQSMTRGTLKVVFFIPSYADLKKRFPKASLKETRSNAYGRQHYEVIEQYCVTNLSVKVSKGEITALMVDSIIPVADEAVAILTHYPVDLLSFKGKENADLIETHTGAIKSKTLWYTKLKGPDGMSRIPFSAWSLQFFGDGKQFNGATPKFKKVITDLAEKKKWTQLTTTELIKSHVNSLQEAEVRKRVLELL